MENQTDADFYVMTFNDADLIYTNYYSFIRIPAHQSVEVECLVRFSRVFSLDCALTDQSEGAIELSTVNRIQPVTPSKLVFAIISMHRKLSRAATMDAMIYGESKVMKP